MTSIGARSSPLVHQEPPGAESRSRRRAQYEQVQELRAQGLSYRAIVAQFHLSRQTVRRSSVADHVPERATRRSKPRKLDPFTPYLEQQLAAGADNGLQLWRDLRDQHGYTGSRALVSRWVAQHRQLIPVETPPQLPKRRRGRPAQPAKAAHPPPQRRLSACKAAWLLICRPEAVAEDDQPLIDRLCAHAPAVDTAHQLAQTCITMVRERHAPDLDD